MKCPFVVGIRCRPAGCKESIPIGLLSALSGSATLGTDPDMEVALLAVDEMFDSGLTVLLDVLAAANALADERPGSPALFDVTVLGVGSSIRTGHGLELATTPLTEYDGHIDLVIAPALGVPQSELIVDVVRDHPTLEWLRAQADAGRSLAAACSGTFFLAEAGALDGHLATTSWWLGPTFRSRYPGVRLDERLVVAQDGRRTTAGAGFAHIDLALAVIGRQSQDLADRVSRHLLLGRRGPQRAEVQPSIASRGPLPAAHPDIRAFERWVRDHLDQHLQISKIAGLLGLSERALQRATAAVLGMSPLDVVHEIRIDQAVHLLRTTHQSPESVAHAVGYTNASSLRALVRRRRGSTLTQLARQPR